jgi:hypothetical protein
VIAALAAVAVTGIAIVCFRAAMAAGEGTAGAAVRILATLILPALTLAFTRLYYWPVALAASSSIALVQLRGAGRFSWTRRPWPWLVLPAVLTVALVAIKASLAIASVPYDVDSNFYHLPMAIAYLQVHSAVPAQVMFHPGNAELLDALGLGALGSVGGQTLTETLVALTLFLAVYGVAAEAGASPPVRFLAACAVFAVPMIGDQILTSQNDVLVTALLLAAIALWRTSAPLAAIAVGLSAGAKFTGPVEALVLLPFIWDRRDPRFSWRHVALAALIAAPWYVRNLVETGNPFFLGGQTAGFSSTIAAHFASMASFWVLTALRNYGGILTVFGIVAALVLSQTRALRGTLAPRLAAMAAVLMLIWFVTPNTAETTPGTLDQIHSGWSLRYALPAIALFNVAAVLWLARTNLYLALAVTTAFLIFNDLRAYHGMLEVDAGVAWFALPLAVAFLAAGAGTVRARLGAGLAVAGCLAFAWLEMRGGDRIAAIWDAQYAPAVGPVLQLAEVRAARRAATIEIETLPVIGPHFERYVVIGTEGTTIAAWWQRLRDEDPQVVVARDVGKTGRMHDKEVYLRASGRYRETFNENGSRVYVPVSAATSP